MPRLTPSLKMVVIDLNKQGKRNFQILTILREQYGFKISRQHIAAFLRRYKGTGLLSVPKKMSRSSKATAEVLDFIDRKMMENDETTSRDLVKALLETLNAVISEPTVKRTGRKLGWLSSGTKYCQLVREVNQAKRLEYCRRLQDNKETFDDVIFTDESSIAMESHARISFHRW